MYRVNEKSCKTDWYFIPATNKCNEDELVDEYVDMTVHSLCKDKHRE